MRFGMFGVVKNAARLNENIGGSGRVKTKDIMNGETYFKTVKQKKSAPPPRDRTLLGAVRVMTSLKPTPCRP
jgi:hypothetical protein